MILRQKATIAALIAYASVLMVSTHMPIPQLVYQAEVSDKWIHVIAYLILVFLLWFSVKPQNHPNWLKPPVWLILIISLAFAGIDELSQPYFGRSCDINDFKADFMGILTGLIIFSFITFWPSLLMVLAINIFSITNLCRADLSKLVPVSDAIFNFFSFGFFAFVWIQLTRLYIPEKSPAIKLLTALLVPAGFMLAVKAGSIILHRNFGQSDLLFGALGILVFVIFSYFTKLLNNSRPA